MTNKKSLIDKISKDIDELYAEANKEIDEAVIEVEDKQKYSTILKRKTKTEIEEEKKDKRRETSRINAQKAREAKLAKKALADQQGGSKPIKPNKKQTKISSSIYIDDDYDDDYDDDDIKQTTQPETIIQNNKPEVIYGQEVKVEKPKKRVMKKKVINVPEEYSNDNYSVIDERKFADSIIHRLMEMKENKKKNYTITKEKNDVKNEPTIIPITPIIKSTQKNDLQYDELVKKMLNNLK